MLQQFEREMIMQSPPYISKDGCDCDPSVGPLLRPISDDVPTGKRKAHYIADSHGGKIISKPKSFDDIPEDQTLLCIIDNKLVGGIVHIDNAKEWEEFSPETEWETFSASDTLSWILIDRGLYD